jgi:ABC-2 type transport system permease protein
MVAPKPGPPRAAPSLRSPLALAVRLHRGAVIWWSLGVLLLALIYGSLTENIEDFLGDNPSMEEVLAALGGASLTDSYIATSLLIIALTAAGPALQIVARLRSEETDQRAEPMLATGTSRAAWVGSHFLVALFSGVVALAVGGLGMGLSYAIASGDAEQVPRLVAASLVYTPALWLLTALAVAVFGLRPRWTAAGWVALILFVLIAMLGELLDLPAWVRDLSPFQHTPAAPAAALELLPLALLSAVAAGLTAIGFSTFRHRDLITS